MIAITGIKNDFNGIFEAFFRGRVKVVSHTFFLNLHTTLLFAWVCSHCNMSNSYFYRKTSQKATMCCKWDSSKNVCANSPRKGGLLCFTAFLLYPSKLSMWGKRCSFSKHMITSNRYIDLTTPHVWSRIELIEELIETRSRQCQCVTTSAAWCIKPQIELTEDI